jgi:hypothetical protein
MLNARDITHPCDTGRSSRNRETLPTSHTNLILNTNYIAQT